MKISELIARIGDDKVEFQNLDNSLIAIDFNAKRGTKITFGTSMTADLDGPTKLGLVVWLDRDAVKAAIAAPSPSGLADANQNPSAKGERG